MVPKPRESKAFAYSYLRFSCAEQMTGDSVRRQTALATAYAKEFGLTLDDKLTYRDFGISSFRGQNAASGRLSDFLAAVSSGLVPNGSLLLVENLDRLSRESALNAQNLLTQIVLAGVTIVTLSDRRTYSVEELRRDPMGLIYALINFIRANEESEVKSFRAKANWVAKRAIASNKVMTARCPGWLTFDKKSQCFTVTQDRTKVVQKIFERVISGDTFTDIARVLNEIKTPTFGAGKHWTRNSISSLVKFSAVVGTVVPHYLFWQEGRQLRRPCQPIRNYYPAIISVEQYQQAQAVRLTAYRGGRGASIFLLRHLIVCNDCAANMQIVKLGPQGLNLVCSVARAGTGCKYSPTPYDPIHKILRKELPSILRDYRFPDERSGTSNRLRAAQNAVDRIRRLELKIHRVKSVRNSPNASLPSLEIAEEALRDAVESYEQRSTVVLKRKISTALECLAEPIWRENQAMLVNRAITALFSKVCVLPASRTIELHHNDGCIRRLRYDSGCVDIGVSLTSTPDDTLTNPTLIG